MQADSGWREARQRLQQAVVDGSAAEALLSSQLLLEFGKTSDVAFCATAFRKLSGALIAHGHQLIRTFLVRSVTVEPLLPALHVEAVLNGYVLDIRVGGYGSYMEELLDPGGAIGGFDPDLVCILLDLEEVAGSLHSVCAQGRADEVCDEIGSAVARIAHMLQTFRSASRARIVLQGCVLPTASSLGSVGDANVSTSLVNAVRDLNQRLAELCRTTTDCVYFDVDQLAANHGRSSWRDDRMFLASRLAVAPGAFRTFANGLLRSASTLFRAPRKVLCTDLDNTFWGGVLGEDGPEGIATGPTFPGNCFLAYQRHLRELAARGILLAITSKNNEADVVEAFKLRSADLALTLDDFTSRKISWDEKVSSLRELASELSLGLDAFVFVDDNPTECEAVRRHLPEVAVVEVPVEQPWRLVGMLADLWHFDTASVTADDRHRSDEYKAQSKREELSRNATTREDFLSSLGIVCTFLSAADAPLERSVQLLSKTNQFNLTTRRYTASEVMSFVTEPNCQTLAVRIRDRFGDAGVVGLALTRQQEEECWIDTLLLSCRVIGRGIETAILSRIAAEAQAAGARWLVGEYVETKKNLPCREFYPQHGFERDERGSSQPAVLYRYDLLKKAPESPSWLTLEGTEEYELADSAVVSA